MNIVISSVTVTGHYVVYIVLSQDVGDRLFSFVCLLLRIVQCCFISGILLL